MTGPIGGYFNDGPEGLSVAQVHTSGYYALQLPDAGIGAETLTLVVLHGWGQNARSFIRKFAPLRQQNVLVVAPQAPHQFYLDMETRKVGFGWMTAFDRDRAIPNLVAGLDTTLDAVEVEYGAPLLCPCILGFSQGVSIAWRYLVHGRRNVAGLVACGGGPAIGCRACTPFPSVRSCPAGAWAGGYHRSLGQCTIRRIGTP